MKSVNTAMVSLGLLNSRMKDFYDIWLLSRQFIFACESLLEAIKRTFENRETSPHEEIQSFTSQFASEKKVQWNAFRRRMAQVIMPESFSDVTEQVTLFLSPIISALKEGVCDEMKWIAPGPWTH